MNANSYERGITLIEMLVVIAVLSLVLAGIYGLLNSAYQSYNHNRAKLESQQTARIVLDYLVYRLREVDAGRITPDPTNCTHCHSSNRGVLAGTYPSVTANIPCPKDVAIPQQAPAILNISTIPLASLSGVAAEFQNMTGNYIQFQADLLPLHGFNESFTDENKNGQWDFYDEDGDSEYDQGETELLEDMNDNTQYDYFGELWTLELQPSGDGPYFELVESLNFTTLSPDISKYNKSVYADTGYTKLPVAYGITALSIKAVPRISSPSTSSGRTVDNSCGDSSALTACHGSSGAINIYGNANNMNEQTFIDTHPFWNIGGLNIEVTTSNTRGRKQQFTKLRQFVILRNLEVNQ